MKKVEVVKQEVDHYYCDACGKELVSVPEAVLAITVRGPVFSSDDIAFEWCAVGDYCEECGKKLLNEVIKSLPVPERYDRVTRDDRLAVEKRLITRSGNDEE